MENQDTIYLKSNPTNKKCPKCGKVLEFYTGKKKNKISYCNHCGEVKIQGAIMITSNNARLTPNMA